MRCPTFLLALLLILQSSCGLPLALSDDRAVDFAADVFPILEKYCIGCHTVDDPDGGLVMEEFAGLLQGGESGVAVTAGEPNSSRLLLMASGKMEPKMPPDDADGPDETELQTLERWIEQGAKGPDGDMPLKRELRTPKIPTAADAPAPITALAQNGQWTAVARYNEVELRSPEGLVARTINDIGGKINAMSFSADGKLLLVATGVTGAYGRAVIFQPDTGELVAELVGHRDTLYAAEFSPNGRYIATAGYDRTIIVWDWSARTPVRELVGHNGAIFDLAFSPDSKVLLSACADETVKVWNVDTGERLDTLSQAEAEVYAVAVTPDGQHIVASSGDNRLRVWRLLSNDSPKINPLIATRFVDESPIVNFAFTSDGRYVVALSESGSVKLLTTNDWQLSATLPELGETASDLLISADSKTMTASLMTGELAQRDLPVIDQTNPTNHHAAIRQTYLDLGAPVSVNEDDLRKAAKLGVGEQVTTLDLPRGAIVTGKFEHIDENDMYRWQASEGEVWAIEADAAPKSSIDPILTVLDSSGQPVLRVRLQAVRDSYFTFRGKDSNQVGDFRVFNWQEMNLSEYLYANGEVTRLWMHPRGPDSGFIVYPGEGTRWTYFGTSHVTHALGEPAYIVRPLMRDEQPFANGLPVFDIYYENDDDPMRVAGKGSRILFAAPHDDLYTIRIGDARSNQTAKVVESTGTTDSMNNDMSYRLTLRAAQPSFKATVAPIDKPIRRGTGREFTVRVERLDGYSGPVTFDLQGLPQQLYANTPLTIEAGQRFATGMIWASADADGWEGEVQPQVIASAEILGKRVERSVGSVGKLTLAGPPSVTPSIQPLDRSVSSSENWTLQVRRGETVSARVVLQRDEKSQQEISFGKEEAGRNATQGVYVDNIGLNGLLVLAGANDRTFFVTADSTAVPGKRSFFLSAAVDGGVTTFPITLEVLP
ncbi:c-type cytochrome domain-containing protein [Stieleria varia]|uniref:WD domain, G-beta repeat n=1 Tax=Stieleria varia TaxID=2528005 RepID=A0A5C6B239_9BACT|nr:c-type cytochrome domain-containing protein [Stieleria varia]TWU04464.1 WD domain, G-beta repeat [Stieleria varia]